MGRNNSKCTIKQVREFWNSNPLAASVIPFPLGCAEYFQHYDKLREESELLDFSYSLHEYRNLKSKRVLDIGCGNGYILDKYSREGAKVFGVDITDAAVKLCRKRFAYSGLSGHFQVSSAEDLPFKDASFDCVCSMGVLHHTPDTQKAVSEAYRVLKKNGIIILMFYHRNSILNRLIVPFNKVVNPKNWTKPVQTMINDLDGCGNPKSATYSRKELRLLLAERFGDLKIFTGLAKAEMLFSCARLFPEFICQWTSRFGWFLYAKGRK